MLGCMTITYVKIILLLMRYAFVNLHANKLYYFQISGKRWKIDLQAKQESHLMLSAVSLPGAVQRRRTAEDELQMRSIFKERDLVSV